MAGCDSGSRVSPSPTTTRSGARPSLAGSARAAGAAADNAEQRRPTMRGFKVAHCRLGKQLRKARARVALLFEQRHDIPKRVEICDLNERALVKLATERKHLTDIIKMVAYQAESDLLALLRPHYARIDQEGRTFCMSCSASAGGSPLLVDTGVVRSQ